MLENVDWAHAWDACPCTPHPLRALVAHTWFRGTNQKPTCTRAPCDAETHTCLHVTLYGSGCVERWGVKTWLSVNSIFFSPSRKKVYSRREGNNVQQKVVSQCLASIDWVHCAQSPCIVGEGKGERVGGRELVSRRLHVAVHVSPSLSHLSIRAPLWFSERWDQG